MNGRRRVHSAAPGGKNIGLESIGRIQPRTRRGDVTDAIRLAILRGDLAPAEHLKEVELSAKVGVSRQTLREAIRELVHEGLLVQEPYKGVRVATVTVATLLGVAKVRVALELVACDEIALRLDDDLRAKLQSAVQLLQRRARVRGMVHFDEAHLAFHGLLFQLSNIPLLEALWPVIEAPTRLAISIDHAVHLKTAESVELHQKLVDAIISRDRPRISRAVHDHIVPRALEVANAAARISLAAAAKHMDPSAPR